MIRWTGLAPWELEFPFPGSLITTFLVFQVALYLPSCERKLLGLEDSVDPVEGEFFIDDLLVRIHFIIVMTRWTGLAPWVLNLPSPGNLTSIFLLQVRKPKPQSPEPEGYPAVGG